VATGSSMNVLLDTCPQMALARRELSDAAAAALRTAPEAWVSVVSPWEVAIKAATGKLQLMDPPFVWFLGLADRYGLREIPLDSHIATAAATLPPIHRDPFDRVLAALAQTHTLTVLTSDKNIPKYAGVKTLW
jgi:PIN domain nuclease of toxin-antitoxin system